MTTSNLKAKGILLLAFVIVLAGGGIIWAIPRMNFKDNITIGLYFILFLLFGFVATVYTLLKDTKKIEIDDNEIRYRNWLTNVTTSYRLNELDGFAITQEITNYGLLRTIYLVKDGKMSGKISEFFYSNFDELLNGVQKIKFLGSFNWSGIKSIKIFLVHKIKLD